MFASLNCHHKKGAYKKARIIILGTLVSYTLVACSYMQPSTYSSYSTPGHLSVQATGMAANNAAEVNTSSINMNTGVVQKSRAGYGRSNYACPRFGNRSPNTIQRSVDRIMNNAVNTTVREINRTVTQAIRSAF